MDSKTLDLILDLWKASLKSKDRKKESVRPNFEELFQKWQDAGATFNDLYESHLPIAIKAHQPVASVVKNTYNMLKTGVKKFNKTEKEFTDEWLKGISDTATETFCEFFKPPLFDQDDEPKVYGSMSAKEYRAQRRYAEQFPTIKTDDLVKQWQNHDNNNLEIEEILKNVLGEDKDGL
jgi:hypothetical protein